MDRAEYFDLHKRIVAKCFEITEAKNHDYADVSDVLYNLRKCEMFGISTETGILVRLLDKFSRMDRFVSHSGVLKVKDESIEDTVCDVINYAVLWLASVKDRRREGSTDGQRVEV